MGALAHVVNGARPPNLPGRLAGDRMPVFELLRGVTLHKHIAVVEGVEVNLDDISVGVVDPHVTERMGHF